MYRIYIMYVNIQLFALCKHPTSYILNSSCTLHMCMNTYMRRIYVVYTAYMYAFALHTHPTSHVSFSRMSNMCMNMYIRRIYIKHICICRVQAPRLSHIIFLYVKYVYGYMYVQNIQHIHHTYMYSPCASTLPLNYYTFPCRMCIRLYISTEFTSYIHHRYMNLPCARTPPLTYYTLVCQICTCTYMYYIYIIHICTCLVHTTRLSHIIL